jgi:lipoprotein-anchoring transpeptidase ErfK/SrfK
MTPKTPKTPKTSGIATSAADILAPHRSRDAGRHPRPVRLVALLLACVLSLGFVACSSSEEILEAPQETTSTTLSPYTSTIATAKERSITVLETDPSGAPSSTTTLASGAPSSTIPAIPRSSLNSAGVKKVDTGFEYSNPTYFKNPLVFHVVEKQGDWLKVLIPVRPNHTVGWVKASEVTLSTTEFRFQLDLATFRLTVFKGAEIFLETDVVTGRDSTPTPVGRFYLLEKIKQKDPNGIYGTWILATNGYSETLETFNGGLPVIALHGTNQPELIGTQASNGCVRMLNDIADQLAEAVPAGTPIDIVNGAPDATSTL